jgi:hypothetical protein
LEVFLVKIKTRHISENLFGEERARRPMFFPKLLPPKENVIQGLTKPDLKPKIKVEGEARFQNFQVNRIQGGTRRNNNPRKNSKRNARGVLNGLCRFCDFHDLEYGYCLLRRLGRDCPYTNGTNFLLTESRKLVRSNGPKALQPTSGSIENEEAKNNG